MDIISRFLTGIQVIRRSMCHFKTEKILDPKNKASFIEKFRNKQPLVLSAVQPKRQAAVIIPLCRVNNELALLFTLKATDFKLYRGHLSFPGGMITDPAKKFENTAMRELKSELGIENQDVEVWCCGNPIQYMERDVLVTTIAVYIKPPIIPNALKIDKSEVREAFSISLENLCKPKTLRYTQYREGYSLPVFLGGARRVWGLTGLVTHFYLSALLPIEVYNHNVKYLQEINPRLQQTRKI